MDYRLLIGAVAAGFVLSGKKRTRGSGSVQRSSNGILINPADSMKEIGLSQSDWPDMVFDIPFAAGVPAPVWPTVTDHSKKFTISYRTVSGPVVGNGSRRFMVNRGDSKYHVGVDLYANPDDPVLSMEDGTVVNYYHFYHGSYALFIQCNSGLVINYGEVKKNSWNEFGISKGSKVKRGQPIARVGLMSGGSHMLHFETYMPPTETNERYFGGDQGPILNPTYYLLRTRSLYDKGVSFSGADCLASRSMNRIVPERLKWIEGEDLRVGDSLGNSVLPELLTDERWDPEKDMADGP